MGVLKIRILLFRVLYWGPFFSETPTFEAPEVNPLQLRSEEFRDMELPIGPAIDAATENAKEFRVLGLRGFARFLTKNPQPKKTEGPKA